MISSAIVAIALIVGSAFSVSAQSDGVTSQCLSTLAGVAASCFNGAGLVILALADNNASLVTPIDTWLHGFCSQSACTNQSLANVINNHQFGLQSAQNGSTDYIISEVTRLKFTKSDCRFRLRKSKDV
ncbi:hypothetical protein HETIRDRAFT_453012 [Heterobasidion irregulare TC 32-1]|uniref:Elicitin n=1 Tax=Heterobasidion irregulare (strain TC 32-1) TaxID=747525 RepID=W4K2P4_HETIT|nr:uncharacterized protein HETIRDRAFT_453012 [Heterobasidion irregulare TC 32-1]ETW80004.1 hypothetical protein HETIRDRAFT_453012 [Heterobasidion irregulare TC 32-1]